MDSRGWTPSAALAGACLVLGSLAWVLLAVLPGRDGSQVQGAPYAYALMAAGLLTGALLGGHPLVAGALLGLPAFVTAPWLAPRGDEDGLWVLWFPVIVFLAGLAAAAHWVGTLVRRRRLRGAPPRG